MTVDGWAHTSGRHNPYAGVREQELCEALNANPYSIAEAEAAWRGGADDLANLAEALKAQKELIREAYKGSGEEAALVYENMQKMVEKREIEMRTVATALNESHTAVTTARTAYYNLPPVRPPSDGSLPPALGPSATKEQKKKHAEKTRTQKSENATADAAHEADKRAAEGRARQALSTLDTSLNGSADKMRGVAGMEKPQGPTGPGATPPVTHALPAAPKSSQPHVISTPGLNPNPIDPGTLPTPPIGTVPVNPNPIDPGTLPTLPTGAPPASPPGVLAGPVGTDPSYPHSVPSALGTSPGSTSTGGTAAGVGAAAVAPGLASAAIRRGVAPVPGATTSAAGATLGRSSATAPAQGTIGRNTMMPGQTAGRMGSAGGRMMPGQGGAGSRGKAGSRGTMAPGTGGGRRKGNKDNKDNQDRVDLLWDDGDAWLGDDETAPQTLS